MKKLVDTEMNRSLVAEAERLIRNKRNELHDEVKRLVLEAAEAGVNKIAIDVDLFMSQHHPVIVESGVFPNMEIVPSFLYYSDLGVRFFGFDMDDDGVFESEGNSYCFDEISYDDMANIYDKILL